MILKHQDISNSFLVEMGFLDLKCYNVSPEPNFSLLDI